MSYLAVGWDNALNHAGVVALDRHGNVRAWRYLAETLKAAKQDSLRGSVFPKTRYKKAVEGEREAFQTARLRWLRAWYRRIRDTILMLADVPVYIGVEDYALHAKGSTHQIAEAGGILRIELTDHNRVRLRRHDPMSVKLYTTGHGHADKGQVQAALRGDGHPWDHLAPAVVEDLYDALAIARLVRAEVEVRAGRVLMSDLQDHERRVFNRVTKPYPVNILDRPWSQRATDAAGYSTEAGL